MTRLGLKFNIGYCINDYSSNHRLIKFDSFLGTWKDAGPIENKNLKQKIIQIIKNTRIGEILIINYEIFKKKFIKNDNKLKNQDFTNKKVNENKNNVINSNEKIDNFIYDVNVSHLKDLKKFSLENKLTLKANFPSLKQIQNSSYKSATPQNLILDVVKMLMLNVIIYWSKFQNI